MFQRIRQYEPIELDDVWYQPRVYGDRQADGTWAGWVVFFPVGGTRAIAPPRPETTQSTMAALTVWATGLSDVYLEGALDRALAVSEQSPLVDRLEAEEYDALDEAATLDAAADANRAVADSEEAAASSARAEAESLRQERKAVEALTIEGQTPPRR